MTKNEYSAKAERKNQKKSHKNHKEGTNTKESTREPSLNYALSRFRGFQDLFLAMTFPKSCRVLAGESSVTKPTALKYLKYLESKSFALKSEEYGVHFWELTKQGHDQRKLLFGGSQ